MPSLSLQLVAKSPSTAPYGTLALAYFLQSFPSASLDVSFVPSLPETTTNGKKESHNALLTIDGEQVVGSEQVQKRLANAFAAEGVYGNSQDESVQIASLLLSLPPTPPTFPSATAFLTQLTQQLTLRTFLVSHAPTLADWAIWGALKANTIALAQMPRFVHVARWFSHISSLEPALRASEDLVAQLKVKAPKAPKTSSSEPAANATFDLGLPNAKMGQVVCRFPPEPSGYLHIGHAKAAILNQYFAKLYQGRFLVRFDDTNPSKEKAEFEEAIIEDLALLGIEGEKTSYTSDYFDKLHIYCVQMIKEGNAYADDTDQETMRAQRMDGIPSGNREMSPEDTLARFAEMATGSEEGRRWCIRAKISFSDPNKAMRDPVIYRGNPLPHHRTGDKFKVYPTYDFACPIVDCLEGVTHALRTNEYRDRNPQYQWMLTALNLRKVEIWDYGRINFVYTLLSKRKLKWFVEENLVRGWDDPRFPTVRGIRRRGMTIEALTQYMLLQGPSQAVTNLEWDVIWNLNKKVIDPVSARHVALEKKDMVKVTITGTGTPAQPEGRAMPKHKKNPDVGEKSTTFADVISVEQEDAKSFATDEEITLMDWGNAFVRKIVGSPVESIEMELHLTGDFKKTKKKVTWLSASPTAPLIPVLLLDYDYLITKKKLEVDDEVTSFLTPTTEFRVDALADTNVRALKKGEVIQFERKGYYIVDKAFGAPSEIGGEVDQVELILIPDGKAASIASKVVPIAADKSAPKAVKAKKVAPAGVANLAKVAAPVGAMYHVPSIYGEEGVKVKSKSTMYEVKKLVG